MEALIYRGFLIYIILFLFIGNEEIIVLAQNTCKNFDGKCIQLNVLLRPCNCQINLSETDHFGYSVFSGCASCVCRQDFYNYLVSCGESCGISVDSPSKFDYDCKNIKNIGNLNINDPPPTPSHHVPSVYSPKYSIQYHPSPTNTLNPLTPPHSPHPPQHPPHPPQAVQTSADHKPLVILVGVIGIIIAATIKYKIRKNKNKAKQQTELQIVISNNNNNYPPSAPLSHIPSSPPPSHFPPSSPPSHYPPSHPPPSHPPSHPPPAYQQLYPYY